MLIVSTLFIPKKAINPTTSTMIILSHKDHDRFLSFICHLLKKLYSVIKFLPVSLFTLYGNQGSCQGVKNALDLLKLEALFQKSQKFTPEKFWIQGEIRRWRWMLTWKAERRLARRFQAARQP